MQLSLLLACNCGLAIIQGTDACNCRKSCAEGGIITEAGPTHHMVAAVGRHIDTILKVAKIFNIPCEVITR